MKKPKAIVLKKWRAKGSNGRMYGYRCLVKCNMCDKEKEYTFSVIRKGGGLFCSTKCRGAWCSLSKRNENHHMWKGGRTKTTKGYIVIKNEETGKYEREHRLVMEEYLGRKLKSHEYVHHKNGIKDDNRLCNLEIVLPTTHKGIVCCPYCEKDFLIQ
jgi:hypothetical protein